MKNTKLRDYLFETIRQQETLEWKILHSYYNWWHNSLPDNIVLEAHIKLLEWIMDTEWIRREDVIHNASS